MKEEATAEQMWSFSKKEMDEMIKSVGLALGVIELLSDNIFDKATDDVGPNLHYPLNESMEQLINCQTILSFKCGEVAA